MIDIKELLEPVEILAIMVSGGGCGTSKISGANTGCK